MPSIQATHTDLYRSGAAYKTGYRCSEEEEEEEGQGRVRARWTADRSVLLIVVAFQATVTLARRRRR
jgi:hypothetical protein